MEFQHLTAAANRLPKPQAIMRTQLLLGTLAATCLLAAAAIAADNPAEKTRELIAVLESNAPLFDKARACQQLGEFGTADAVPALASLLADEHLNAYARSGLEGIPDPRAAEALRTATVTLQGDRLAGVINSLGVLRDAKAVSLLRTFVETPASGVAREALLALGRTANDESIAILRQALTAGPEANRADAAAACLLAAGQQLAEGHAETAVALYDSVRLANVPAGVRVVATRGAIVARNENGVPLLIEQLNSDDRLFRNAALLTIREIPSDTLARALNAELNRAPAELQVQLLTALVDCHNRQSLAVLRDLAAAGDVEVRKMALRVLGQIGGAAETGVLLEAVADNRRPEEAAVARESLQRMAGAGVDAQIRNALVTSPEADARVQFIRLLQDRGATSAVKELLRQAADPGAKVSVAAFQALKSLAGREELPALIALTRACKHEAAREAAENAVVAVCTRTGNAASGSDMVQAELRQRSDPVLQNSWIRILVSLGDARALPAVLAAMHDGDETVAAHAIEQLARWPDPSPAEALAAVVQTGTNPALRQPALVSLIRLATTAAEEHQRPNDTLVEWFQIASQAAQTIADRRLIVSGLGRLQHPESFRLLTPYLDGPDLRNEAAMAIVQIAPALRQQDPAAVKEVLERIAATVEIADIRGKARAISLTIPAPVKPVSLFDGRSLAGWEGNTNVWRVRDGVIVGGSLDGNPRNEFLAATRRYTNFVLRLEYKLVGTEGFVNGGVQFHSQRVSQPANEMSGFQADLGAGHSGCLYDESRRNRFVARAPDEQIQRLEKPGEWNRYEVRCAGPRIQILLNGGKTVDYVESDPTIPLGGLIALQIHGNCRAEISFRNLTIEKIDQDASGRVGLRNRPGSARYFKLASLDAPNHEPYAGAAEVDALGRPVSR